MARKLNAPEDIGGSSTFLSATDAGWFLLTVTDAFEGKRQTKDGFEMMDGISIETEVVGGPHDSKRYTLNLWDPKMSSKDEGKSAAAKQAAFLIATDVLSPKDLGKEVEYETTDSIGAYFVIELVAGRPNEQGKSFLEPNYANIYHIDDPRGARKLTLDASQKARLDAYDKKFRHPAEYFERLTKKPTAKAESSKDLDFAGL